MNLLGRLLRKEGFYPGPSAGIIFPFLCQEVMVGEMSLFHSTRFIAAGFQFLQDLIFLPCLRCDRPIVHFRGPLCIL